MNTEQNVLNKKTQELLVGYSKQSGEAMSFPNYLLSQHISICADDESESAFLTNSLIDQQIRRGGGLLSINFGLSENDLDAFRERVSSLGRQDDLMVLSPNHSGISVRYNPILLSDPLNAAHILLSSMSPEMDKQAYFSALKKLSTILAALKKINRRLILADISETLESANSLMQLQASLHQLEPASKESIELTMLLDRYTENEYFDMQSFMLDLNSLDCYLAELNTGAYDSTLNSIYPMLTLKEAVLANKIILVSLPENEKHAAIFAKLLVNDFRNAVSELQTSLSQFLPNPHFLVFAQNANLYIDTSWSRLLEQARFSKISLIVTHQQVTDSTNEVTEMANELLMGNTRCKLFFKQNSDASAKKCADEIGVFLQTSTCSETSEEIHKESYVLSPEKLKTIPKGECYLFVSSEELHHLKLAQA